MMGFKFPVTAISMTLLLLTSCTSVRGLRNNTGEAIMFGMVYNEENIPVSSAEVIVNGRSVAITDSQGRFIVVSKQRNEFSLSLVKAGYETVTGTFRFEPMDVIHLIMVNAEQLIKQAEFAMDEGRYNDVVTLCDRALALNPGRIDASYLKALSLVRLRDYINARYILEELQKRIGDREYIRRILEELQ